MNKVQILLIIFSILLPQNLHSQFEEPKASPELMKLIREQKFEVILPHVMRDNKVDMWIHVKRKSDFFDFGFGEKPGIYIFTDRGGVRIERAVLGGQVDRELYDILAPESYLGKFIAERNPKRIALNYTDRASSFNSMSLTDRKQLSKIIGKKYSKRIVPADRLAADYLAGRGMAEVALFGRLLMISTEKIEGEFNKIVPGKTRLSDISGNVFVRDYDGNEENNTDYIVQPGDLIGILNSANMMDFSEHNGGIGYVLRKGETNLPPEVQRIWEHALITRNIFRKNITAGATGAEQLEILIEKLEEAGYVYIDKDQYDKTADPEKTQVHIDFHAMGRIISQEEAPRISPSGWGRNLKIPLYHTFTFEYMIHMPVPEFGKGKHLYICIHDGVIVTERGVEFPAAPIQGIRIIR